MLKHSSYEPLVIPLPEDLFIDAKNSFERWGEPLDASLARCPELAYSIFGNCIMEAADKATLPSGPTLPELGNGPRDVVIEVIKNPTFLKRLLGILKGGPTIDVETALTFRVGERRH